MSLHFNHLYLCRSAKRNMAGLSLLAFVLSTAAAGAEDVSIAFVHHERSLQPGEIVLVEANSSKPLSQLRIEAFDRQFPAFTDKGRIQWAALLGIDLETKSGEYTVLLSGTDLNGKRVTAQEVLVVTAKRFPTRKLTVDPKYVEPPEHALIRIKEERRKVNDIFSSVTPERLWEGPFHLPVPGQVISAFGKRNVYNGKPRSPHTGTDFRGAEGTPIKAPNSGKVVLAANLYYSGNTLILDHGLGLYSYFGHMSAFSVKEGDYVKTGDLIGKVGATGNVTGPHLHWTVRLVDSRVDPLSLVTVLSEAGTQID
jgi:murein DD-endopeptidase MepM/ murein hydrolase activator NlpD